MRKPTFLDGLAFGLVATVASPAFAGVPATPAPIARNQRMVIGPMNAPTRPVPCDWIMKRQKSTKSVIGIT